MVGMWAGGLSVESGFFSRFLGRVSLGTEGSNHADRATSLMPAPASEQKGSTICLLRLQTRKLRLSL